MKYRKAFALFLAFIMSAGGMTGNGASGASAKQAEKQTQDVLEITAPSAVLIENAGGRILYEKEKDQDGRKKITHRFPATIRCDQQIVDSMKTGAGA